MRGREARWGIAGSIGGLLHVGSSGNSSVVANGVKLTGGNVVSIIISAPLLWSAFLYMLRPIQRQPIREMLSHNDPDLADNLRSKATPSAKLSILSRKPSQERIMLTFSFEGHVDASALNILQMKPFISV